MYLIGIRANLIESFEFYDRREIKKKALKMLLKITSLLAYTRLKLL
jgi:hypothetical protein